MNALLTADEAARLVPGERLVIMRPGERRVLVDDRGWPSRSAVMHTVAPQDWVALTGPCPTCGGTGLSGEDSWITEGRAPCVRCRDGRRIEPLYTECPDCYPEKPNPAHWNYDGPYHIAHYGWWPCLNEGRVLVGRGSIEVVPVVDVGGVLAVTGDHIYVRDGVALLMTNGPDWGERTLTLDPLPVPGRDFGIALDCVGVAS